MGRAEGEAHERQSSGHGDMLLVFLVFHLVIRHAIPKESHAPKVGHDWSAHCQNALFDR
jgi:hypothetical protein